MDSTISNAGKLRIVIASCRKVESEFLYQIRTNKLLWSGKVLYATVANEAADGHDE